MRLKKIKPITLKRQLAIVSDMYNTAASDWGYLGLNNPIGKIKLQVTDQRRERRLKDGEFDLIMKEAARRKNKLLIPVIHFLVETGMRRSEVLNCLWSHVDLKQRLLVIPDTKNGRSRTIPITKPMMHVLEGLDPVEDRVFPIKQANLKNTWERVLAKVGIKHLHMHDLRHEAVSSYFEKGLQIQEVAAISGHQSYKMLQRYTHLNPLAILRKLEPVA
jgi:integrase